MAYVRKRDGIRRLAMFGVTGLAAVTSGAQAASPNDVGEVLQRPPNIVAPSVSPLAPSVPTKATPPTSSAGQSITVRSFQFVGNTAFSSETLAALVSGYQNRPLSLAQLYDAADTVGRYYTDRGYALATATIPAQNVGGGAVTIEVIEGFVESLRFNGLKSYRSDDLLTYLPEIRGSIYNGAKFEQGLRDIDELPGLSGRAVLQPGKAYGTTEVVIETKEKRIEGEVFLDNSGREAIGEYRMAGQVTVNNPSGAGDSVTLLGLRSTNNRLKYLYGSYGLPLGFSGARLNLSYGYAEFNVGGSFSGVEGDNRTARGEVVIPIVRSVSDRFALGAAVSNTKANTDLLGVALPGAETDLTLLELSSNYAHTWRDRAVTQLTGNIGSNFRVYDPSDANTYNHQRFRLEADLQHLQPLIYGLQVRGRTNFVYSPDQLPATQAYALGGPASVRGYAPSEVRGDWGYQASVTLQRPMQVMSAVLTPRLFVDSGRVRSRQPETVQPEVSLTSVGVGADLSYRQVTAHLDLAVPTDGRTTSDNRDDGRIYGSIAYSF